MDTQEAAHARPAFKPQEYAFTEIRTIVFHEIPRPGTGVNGPTFIFQDSWERLWQKTLSTYASCPGARLVCWMYDVESPQTVKLVLDWGSVKEYEDFTTSLDYRLLEPTWAASSHGSATDKVVLYVLDSWTRHVPFSEPARFSADSVTIILTWRFSRPAKLQEIRPVDYRKPQRTVEQVFSNAFTNLNHMILRTAGGCPASSGSSGWSVAEPSGEKEIIAMYRMYSLELAKSAVQLVQQSDDLYEHGCLGMMGDLADDGTHVQYVRVKCSYFGQHFI